MTAEKVRDLGCHCSYTNAIVGPIFSLKIAFLAVCSGSMQRLICNQDHIKDLKETLDVSSTLLNPTLFAKAHVASGNQVRGVDDFQEEDTTRDVFMINLT